MKIYTKTGDNGETSLYGGKRVPKHSHRIEAYGTVDELNAQLGVVRALQPPQEIDAVLNSIQNQLFVLGADLATPADAQTKNIQRINRNDIQSLEQSIDHFDGQLEPLQSFILPGGSQAGAQLHVARTVCRRAERRVNLLSQDEAIDSLPLIYLNRLADLLFVLARYTNKLEKKPEKIWKSK